MLDHDIAVASHREIRHLAAQAFETIHFLGVRTAQAKAWLMAKAEASAQMILQLRAVLRGISPLIWRRLLVPSDTSIAQLHEVLQVAFGWEDMHLHRFEIRGREYGLSREGGMFFRYGRSKGKDWRSEAAPDGAVYVRIRFRRQLGS